MPIPSLARLIGGTVGFGITCAQVGQHGLDQIQTPFTLFRVSGENSVKGCRSWQEGFRSQLFGKRIAHGLAHEVREVYE